MLTSTFELEAEFIYFVVKKRIGRCRSSSRLIIRREDGRRRKEIVARTSFLLL
jgi:hypothetical protein